MGEAKCRCDVPVRQGAPRTVTSPRAVAQCVVSYLDGLGVDAHGNYGVHDNIAVRMAASKGLLDVVRYLCELPVDRGVDPYVVAGCSSRIDMLRLSLRIQQQALTSLVRSPLFAVRALIRQHRATSL